MIFPLTNKNTNLFANNPWRHQLERTLLVRKLIIITHNNKLSISILYLEVFKHSCLTFCLKNQTLIEKFYNPFKKKKNYQICFFKYSSISTEKN